MDLAMPHPSVPASAFYKHLDATLPDAERLRHLLVWCANRNLTDTSKTKLELPNLSASQIEKLKAVKTEVLKRLTSKKIEVSLTSYSHDTFETAQLGEHEQNAKNKQREAKFLREIEKCVYRSIRLPSLKL